MGEATPSSRVGTQFGQYHLKRLLGRGGMGEVYEAEDTVKDRVVALKLMSQELGQDPVFRKRMQREAHTAGRLQEPHVVPIHDFGEIDGQLYLEMRLVEGADLDSILQRFGPLTPPRAVAIIRQVAAALDAAHAAGVMHRDVKPQNILITRDDFAYLVDFGIASATTDEKLTQLGTAVGTWKYMAPERFSADAEVTYRADIYALACVLYECLTGAPPYRTDSAGVLIRAHMMDPIPQPSRQRPGIPQAFDAVIARGMAKNPQARYASAGDLALAAHQALSTPDQDHAATLLRRSTEATLPHTAGTVAPFTSNKPPTPPPTANPPSYPPSHPQAQPPGAGGWTPAGGPVFAPSTAPPTQYPGGQHNWAYAAPPPPSPPWNPPRKRNPWPLVAAAALLLMTALAGVSIWLLTRPKPQPAPDPVPAARLNSLLIDPTDINAIMGASNMQPDKPITEMGTAGGELSNPDCRGAIDAGRAQVYEGSSYNGVSGLEVHEPGTSFDHWVIEYAVAFPTAETAHAFFTSSADKWKSCAGQNIADTTDGKTNRWSLGALSGTDPTIALLNTSEGGNGWNCQRVLRTVSNVVFDVTACAYSAITDQGTRIADKMAAQVT